ncbi:hypothetical protein EDC04DRAFT_2901592 [Pisolithus marmoratus]|nr:hypothetical protein EDC04DRAFT_2901592 [Pisolithus marmoratus]
MNSATKKRIAAALDVMEDREITFVWSSSYGAVHNANTSQLGGLKPGSRRDSASPNLYWVAMFESKGKQIIPPPLIEASFATEPNTPTAVAKLREVLQAA